MTMCWTKARPLRPFGHGQRQAGAAHVWTTVLVRKNTPRNEAVDIDFVGLRCPDRYLFGCGMDYRRYWRNLPAVYALPEDLEHAR